MEDEIISEPDEITKRIIRWRRKMTWCLIALCLLAIAILFWLMLNSIIGILFAILIAGGIGWASEYAMDFLDACALKRLQEESAEESKMDGSDRMCG